METKYLFGTLGVEVSLKDRINLLKIINGKNLKRRSDNLNHPAVQRRILVKAYEAGWRPRDWSIGNPEMLLHATESEYATAIREQENFLKDLRKIGALDKDTFEAILTDIHARRERLNSGR